MPATVLDVEEVYGNWVVLLDDERLLLIGGDSKKTYFDIKNTGEPDCLIRSQLCAQDEQDHRLIYFVTLARRPVYSTHKPFELISKKAEQNRYLTIFDVMNKKIFCNEKMQHQDPDTDALLELPYVGITISPLCRKVFREVAQANVEDTKRILDIVLDTSTVHDHRVSSISYVTADDEWIATESGSRSMFDQLNILLSPLIILERGNWFGEDEEDFIIFEKKVYVDDARRTVELDASVIVYGSYTGITSSAILSDYCSELCRAKRDEHLRLNLFMTDTATVHLALDDVLICPECCFIGGTHGIIYFLDMTISTWQTVPTLQVAVMSIENITYDSLHYNMEYNILIARGTEPNGRSRWYVFRVAGILNRIVALSHMRFMRERNSTLFYPTAEARELETRRLEQDLRDYLVVASSVFDFGPDILRCSMNKLGTTMQIASLKSCETLTYAKGTVMFWKRHTLLKAIGCRNGQCKISKILSEELILYILEWVAKGMTFSEKWLQLGDSVA